MAFYIEDGEGTGVTAGVSSEHRMKTTSAAYTALQFRTANGGAYNINVGTMTLTSSQESGIVFFKNTSATVSLQFDRIHLSVGKSTSGSGDVIIRYYQNPTAGTLLTYAQPVTGTANRNFGFSKPIPATTYKGGDGTTATGGTFVASFIVQDANFYLFEPQLVLAPGTSVAITMQPKTGNVSLLTTATVNLFEITQDNV
jgi:hypothetical protein